MSLPPRLSPMRRAADIVAKWSARQSLQQHFAALMTARWITTHSSGTSKISPEEAGRRAHQLAQSTRGDSTVGLSTHLAHAGLVSSIDNTPMSPPIHLATTYTRPPDGPYHDNDSKYARMDNPTRLLLEETIGRLECHGDTREVENAVSCAFASGMGAVSSVVMAHASPVTVLVPADLYHGVPTVLEEVMKRFQVKYEHVDFTDTSSIEQAITSANSRDASDLIVWMETPSNPMCHVIDIAQVCHIVQQCAVKTNIMTVVDSTLAPPCLTQPLRLGADISIHSATKYLGGHSDVLVGVATMSPWTERGRQMGPRLQQVQEAMGAVASPFDSWLTLRGLRSLHVRVERQSQTALRLAQHLQKVKIERPSSVTAVHYPGLDSHSRHAVAKKQMKNGLYGGVLSVEFGSEAFAMAVAASLTVAQRATSLGGTETLVEHRASIEPEGRVTSPVGLLRVSVGLEDADDLIRDFDRAIAIAQSVVA